MVDEGISLITDDVLASPMRRMLLAYTVGLWIVLMVLAILNAGLREGIVTPSLGDTAGRAIGSILLACAILLVAYLFLSRTSIDYSGKDLWLMGAIWLVLTLAFEFGFGHFVMGNSWDTLLADYNVLNGRIWVLVLIASATGPYLMGSLVNSRWL